MRNTITNLGRVAAILAFGGVLVAQGVQTGNLEGRITDPDGGPIAGAAVRLETGQGVRETTTDAQGRYRMALLTVGPCTLSVSARGYIGQKASTRVILGQTNVVNLTLRTLAVATETVEISATEAIIDPTRVTDGKNTSAADFANLPINGRGVANIASITPGMISNTVRGAQSNHTQWLLDGVDVMDPVTGGGIMYLNEETIQEVQVVTGGATADMGRFTGGMVNVVTKSGTNKYQGTLRFEMTNPDWQAMRPMASKADSHHTTLQLYHVSGPIWKDHIFFSAGYRVSSPVTRSVGYTSADPDRGGNQQYYAYNTDERMDFKLDWHITPYHRVFGIYNNTKMDRFGIDYPTSFGYQSTSWETLSAQPDEYGNMAFGYVGTLTDNLVLKANYGKKNEKLGGPGGGGQGGPGIPTMIDLETYALYDNGFFGFDSDDRPVENGTLSANWFLDSPFGSHDLKFGLDYFKSSRNAANAQCPTGMFMYFDGFINDPATHGTGLENRLFNENSELEYWKTFEGATNTNTIWSYYANDKVKFNDRLSANVGVRIDKFTSENDIQARNFDITAFSPRLTAVYDPFANGRWIFELGYNQYAGQIMQGATDGASVVGNPAEYHYEYIGGPGNLRSSYSDEPYYVYDPEAYRASNLIDPNMKPPTMDEMSLVARFSDGRRGYYSLSFSTRTWKNFVSTWKYEQENPVDWQDTVVNLIANDPLLKRDYKGLEFQWEKQFTDSFYWGGNLTLSETKGNFEGGQTGSDGPLRSYGPLGHYDPPPNPSSPAWAWQPTERQLAPYGRLSNDRPLTIRTWGTWQKDVFGAGHINLGFFAEFNSGAPYSVAATQQLRYNYVDGIYGSSYTRYFSERGALRFNSYYNTSVQVAYDHSIWKGVKAFGIVNITNFFNHQIQVDWNTSGNSFYSTGASATSGPWAQDYFNRPTARFFPGATYGQATSAGNFIGARNLRVMFGLRF